MKFGQVMCEYLLAPLNTPFTRGGPNQLSIHEFLVHWILLLLSAAKCY
jgi:hypothetical protein